METSVPKPNASKRYLIFILFLLLIIIIIGFALWMQNQTGQDEPQTPDIPPTLTQNPTPTGLATPTATPAASPTTVNPTFTPEPTEGITPLPTQDMDLQGNPTDAPSPTSLPLTL